MPWFFYAIISVFGTALANIFQKILMKDDKSDPVVFSITFQFLLFVLTFIFALFKGFVLPPLLTHWLYFVLGAVLYAFAVITNFYAVKKTDVSNVVIIGTMSSITTIIFAVLLLNDDFSLIKSLGTGLIILSIIILYKNRKFEFDQGFYYALLSAILFGLAVVNDAFILKSYDAISYTPVMSLLPGFVMGAIYQKKLPKIHTVLTGKRFQNIFLLSLFYSIAAVCFYLAIVSGGNASQVSPINRASIIVTVLLAAILLKEREHLLRKFLSAILVTVGVLLLI